MLFVGTGASISGAGPGGAVVSYGVIGVAIYFMMAALGEMVTHRPVAGAFETYTGEYVEPALGFTVGWMYWYSCAMTIAVELVASSIIMKYWFPDSPSLLWNVLFLYTCTMGKRFYVTSCIRESAQLVRNLRPAPKPGFEGQIARKSAATATCRRRKTTST